MLTIEYVNKHFPEADKSDKGHMKMQQMNVRLTKKNLETDLEKVDAPTPKKEDVYIYIFNAHNTVYTNQTGGFPVTSSRGNKYVMVMCKVDGTYWCRANEKLNIKKHGVDIPNFVETPHRLKSDNTQVTHPRQLSTGSITWCNTESLQNAASISQHAPKQFGRKSNINI